MADSIILRVFYGWARTGKVRKREALSVIFENDRQCEDRTRRFINRMQKTVYERKQTPSEAEDSIGACRMFTEFSIFLDDAKINGSLEAVLNNNFRADENHLSREERERIKAALRSAFICEHPEYREPKQATQLQLFQ